SVEDNTIMTCMLWTS
nr:immunoglobulin heavy chain junction region [Mus musculus]